jgi:hypothetical protein
VTPDPALAWIETDDRCIMAGPGLRIVFARSGDRWTHTIELPLQAGIEAARAVESPADHDSPGCVHSPVYQEIQRHEPAGHSGLCLLLTGCQFQHHFSAAVSLRKLPEPAGGLVLDFDVADRCRAPVHRLAATYLVRFDASARLRAGSQSIAWATGPESGGRLELRAQPPATVALAEAARAMTRVQAVAALLPETLTHRLRYEWRWTSATGFTR